MRIPNWAKILWYLALVVLVVLFVVQRWDSIIIRSPNMIDIIMFVFLLALVTAPLFQQVNFFGLGLKNEIDKLRTDVKEQVMNLRTYIQSTISMRTEISPQIQFFPPPPDSELPSIEERIRPILEQTLKEIGIEKPAPITEETRVPDATQFLFSVRYEIESELKRIWKQQWAREPERSQTFLIMLYSLDTAGIIRPELYDGIRNVHYICSAAIHGEAVSENAVNFVRDLAPRIIATLKAINVRQR